MNMTLMNRQPKHHKRKCMPRYGAATSATRSYRFIQR